MNHEQRLNLSKMMKEFDVVDQTQNIRSLKHSEQIRINVNEILKIQKMNPSLSKDQLEDICLKENTFLFTNYTDIYNRLIKKELDLKILFSIIQCLKKIEDGDCNQQEASFEVGSLLKKMYIDSALKQSEKLDKITDEIPSIIQPHKAISWNDYKNKK